MAWERVMVVGPVSVFRGKILSLAREGLLIEGERHAHVIHHIHAAFLEESCPLQASGSIH